MRAFLCGLLGAVLGALATVALLLVPLGPVRDAVFAVSSPMAHLLSLVSGWPLMQEGAMVLYLIAAPSTGALFGGLAGAAFGLVSEGGQRTEEDVR